MRLTVLLVTATCLALPVMAKMPSNTHSKDLPKGLTVADWSQIRAEYERHRHGMFADRSGYKARSFEQQWLARFDGRGVSLEPNEGAWRWGLELAGVTGKAPVSTDINRITYRWSADLDEWFLNDTRGLEHGFTLKAPREIRLAVRGGLRPRETGMGVEFVDASGTARMKYTGLAAFDADGQTLRARMQVAGEQVMLAVQDRGARYPITIDPIAQQAYLKASNTENSELFSASVAVSGDTVVVGAYQEDSMATGVNGDQADNSAPQAGAAYVFARSGVTWTQQAYLKASNTGAGDAFGISVAVSGDTVVVGASGEDSNATGVDGNQGNLTGGVQSGAVYVFVRSGVTWTQQAYLKASNTGTSDAFGTFVAISGDTVVVGAFGEDSNATGVNGNQADNSATDSGAAYVFVRSGGWSQQAYLKASNSGASDNFGFSVAVSGDTVVVGAYHEDSNATGVNGDGASNSSIDSGAAYVFARNGGAWTQQAYLKASNTEQMGALASDLFGWSVAVSGDTVVIGAYQEDGGATGVNGNQFLKTMGNSGAAYVFVRSGVTWTQQAYLKASNTGMSDLFGYSVAVSGDTILVGAYGEASNATGVNGNQADNSATQTGAVYVFVRNGVTWSQSAYLKASTNDGGDAFSYSIAVSGDTAVIGARNEDSNAIGVNGDQSNNSATESGAAYVFTGLAATANVTINSSPSGLLFNSSGTGCAPGTGYVTPQVLVWAPGSSCSLSFGTPQTGPGSVQYSFDHWEDNSISATRAITAPANPTSYTAVFVPASGSQPDLTITKTHLGNFTQGQTGATYTITVTNSGSLATAGTVTVTDTLPTGLTATAMAGTGWTCPPPSGPCTRNDVLAAGNSYPTIAFTVTVAGNAAATVTNTATVSGGNESNTGNDAANDSTTIQPTNQQAVGVLRDASNKIRLTAYPSATLSDGGGSFASDPAVAENLSGSDFVTARDSSNAIWTNVFNPGTSTWAGWQLGGGATVGMPAIAVAPNGTAWIAARDAFGSYWLVSYTSGSGYGTWVPLAGAFVTDPAIAACGDGSLYIGGKDGSTAMWSGRYVPGTGFQNWVLGGGAVNGKASITCGSDNAAYLVARDSSNSNWIVRISGNTWGTWLNGGAQTTIDPKIAALGGSVAVVILGGGGAVWRNTFNEGSGNGWQTWTNVGGGFSDIAPAGVSGELFFIGKALNNDLWWWRQTGSLFTWINNNGVAAGALAAALR